MLRSAPRSSSLEVFSSQPCLDLQSLYSIINKRRQVTTCSGSRDVHVVLLSEHLMQYICNVGKFTLEYNALFLETNNHCKETSIHLGQVTVCIVNKRFDSLI